MSGRLRYAEQVARKAKAAGPKVVLVMIVRDEAAIIGDRLKAIRGEVDGFVIVDTGSTDRTPEIVHEVLADLPGALYRRKWAGFADGRTAAVAFAQKWAAEQGGEWWALLLDADTIWKAAVPDWRLMLDPEVARSTAGADAISCAVEHGAIRYSHPRLLKLGARAWRWRGVLHEYLDTAGARVVESGLISVEHGSGGARSRDPEKYWNDAQALQAEIRRVEADPEHEDRGLLPRYQFYLAQSLRDAQHPILAEGAYERRTEMGGFFQEVYLAWLNIGESRLARGEAALAFAAFSRAWGVDPSRAEALVGLATICRLWESWTPALHFGQQALIQAPTSAGMFADQNVGWRAHFEASVAAWYCGKLGQGRSACVVVLADPLAPPEVKDRTRANLALYEGALARG